MSHIIRRWIAALTLLLTTVCVTQTSAQTPPANGLLREVWSNIPGGLVSDLTNNAAYPNNPTSTNYVTDFFEAPVDIAEWYGQRMRGYVVPPTTGNYVFWVATDDQGVLFLSTDSDPANKRQIASVPGWTSSRNWFSYGEQQSAAISLQGGRAYYIEGLMKEDGGGDNLGVRWQLPDGTMEEPIPASRLRPWGIVFTAPQITQQPSNTTAVEGGDATFSVKLSNLDPVFYQWQRGGVNIAGANGPDYVRTSVVLADNNSTYRCFVSNSLGNSFSAAATLTVTADTTKPTLAAAQNASANTIQLSFSEPVEATSATTAGNYTIDGGLTISGAVMGADTKTVILTTSGAFTYNTVYTVRVSNVKDRAVAGNVILANSAITFTAREYVPINIGGTGSTTSVSGGVDVSGMGADIGGTSDQFHFGYQQRTGNFDIQVRVANLAGADMWTKAGLMARETLTVNSRFAAAFATPSLAGAFALNRQTVGGATAQTGFAPVNYPNTWLRLARAGNIFTSYASIDGQTWVNLGSVTIAMPATIYLGMAVTSHNATQSVTAQFRDIGAATGTTIVSSLTLKGEPLAASSRRTGMIVSEIHYHPAARADGKDLEFVELFNTDPVNEDLTNFRISGEIDYVFAPGTTLPAGGFLVVAKDPAAIRAVYGIDNVVGPYAGSLSNDSGDVRVHNESDAEILDAHFSDKIGWPLAADGAGQSLVLARPSYGEGMREAWAASALMGGSPGRAEPIRSDIYEPLVINEILAHTDDPQKDYIEIYNHSNAAIDLSGVSLADNREFTNRFTFVNGTSIPARGFVAVDQDALGFALNAGGETVYLVASNSVRVIDAVGFEGQQNGVAYGRYPDGAARFTALQSVTQGAANARPLLRNVVINEIMYHPISDDDDDEYVELFNRSGATVDVSGWRFTDGVDFIFPPGSTIAANGYLVVAKNVAHLRTNYVNLNSANSIGDYDGTLSNSGERLALSMPDEVVSTNQFGVTTTNVIYIVVAEVEYNEGGRWGQWADGGGSSLELVDPHGDLTQSSSWANSDESTKAPWTTIQATGVLDNGAMSNPDQFQMLLQGGGECMVDDI
ncbi:MAG TPA: lamin tail domain-containing protein, partial [Verrucomicrobiae bacterium]|nr:lamin tail domain-containing protein [Verrucomicrobiae bacterium]